MDPIPPPQKKTETKRMDVKTGSILWHPRDVPQHQEHISPRARRLVKHIPSKKCLEQSGIAILIPNEIEFKPRLIRRERKGHYILIKGKISTWDITILNIYDPKTRAV